MFEAVRKYMFGRRDLAERERSPDADEMQVAQAALMFHVIAVDGTITEAERGHLAKVLSAHFSLDDHEVDSLIEEARRADEEAIDLYSFTRILKHEMVHEDRLSLIARLWEMVFADGVVHEFEDNIVWRVAELLDIDTRDRMELKRTISAKMSSS